MKNIANARYCAKDNVILSKFTIKVSNYFIDFKIRFFLVIILFISLTNNFKYS